MALYNTAVTCIWCIKKNPCPKRCLNLGKKTIVVFTVHCLISNGNAFHNIGAITENVLNHAMASLEFFPYIHRSFD